MIKRITAKQAYPLRQAILRPDGTLQDCIFNGDELATTHHYGYFDDETLVAIASVYERDFKDYKGRGRQLRSMAVAKGKQGQGLGHKLLAGICQQLSTDTDYLWANARVSAINFYRQASF
ncbi:MAG: GNAT family N-acetyltransferase, partial [Psychrobium sp.]